MNVETRWEQRRSNGVIRVADLILPKRFSATATDAGWPFSAELQIELQAGRYNCTRLTLEQLGDGGGAITTEAMRAVPVGQIIRRAVQSLGGMLAFQGKAPDGSTAWGPPAQPPANLSEGGPTDDALRHVARVYRLAYVSNDPPTAAVAEQLDLTRATAKRWVGLARERGLLGPAEERKAGGV